MTAPEMFHLTYVQERNITVQLCVIQNIYSEQVNKTLRVLVHCVGAAPVRLSVNLLRARWKAVGVGVAYSIMTALEMIHRTYVQRPA